MPQSVAVLALALLALPAAAQPIMPDGALAPMTEAAVRALLTDVEIGPECCDNSEAFYVDGTYVHLGYAPDPGQYTVAGNRVCVTTEYRPKAACRRLYRDKAGTAFFIKDGDKSAKLADPRPAPDRTYWQYPPNAAPRLEFQPPPGYVISSHFEGKTGDTTDYVPAAERNNSHKTSWIVQFVLRDDKVTIQDYFVSSVKDPIAAWPGATAKLLSNEPENGYVTISARLTFPNAFPGDLPQVEYVKLIEAPPVLYFVRYSFRGAPDAAREAAVLEWLKTIRATSRR